MEMQIKRIDSYDDERFSTQVLHQHGAFVVNNSLVYEVEIISQNEAIIRGDKKYYKEVIGEFRFFAEHITKFYDKEGNIVIEFKNIPTIDVSIIPLVEYGDRYISMDGHTRLSVAIDKGFKSVKGIIVQGDDYLYKFVEEAIKRNVKTPYDLEVLSHEDYDIKWNRFCDEFFEQH